MNISKIIKSLGQLTKVAKLEGEGLGTSYEYIAKYNVILPLIKDKNIKNVTIYGLPEKYGYSMDLVLLGLYLNAEKIIVMDDRIGKLENFKKILLEVFDTLNLDRKYMDRIITINTSLVNLNNPITADLVLSCEVLQRFDIKSRIKIVNNIKKSKNYAIFVPNGENEAHAKISKLNTIYLNELMELFPNSQQYGYVDCPPTPPGIRLSKNNNIKKTSLNLIEKTITKLLWYWFKTVENVFFKKMLNEYYKKNAHIIYAIRCDK